jgi:pectinesterase inhibitor-like protein
LVYIHKTNPPLNAQKKIARKNTMSCFASLVLILFLSLVAFSDSIGITDVNAICQKSRNPTSCYKLLNQKSGADLVTLAQFTIDTTRADVSNAINLINTLISQAKDPKAKQHYQLCLSQFGSEGALKDVQRSQQLLMEKDYSGLSSAASSVFTDVDDCIRGASPSDPPYPDPSMLPQYANVVLDVVDITLVISNMLNGKNLIDA